MTICENFVPTPAPSTFRKTEYDHGNELENESYTCCAEWHLRRLPGVSGVCLCIYPLAYRLTANPDEPSGRSRTRTFYGSAESLAVFYRYSPSQVRRGLTKLEELGFFELLSCGRFRTNQYRVVSHKEWAQKHPGRCTRRVTITYFENGDPLGQELHSASGGQIKFPPITVSNLHKLGLHDDFIVEQFAEFWRETGSFCDKRSVPARFYMELKSRAIDEQTISP